MKLYCSSLTLLSFTLFTESQIAMDDPILPQIEMEKLVISQNPISNAPLDEVMKFVSSSCKFLDSPANKFSELLGLRIAKTNESMGEVAYMVSNYAILELAKNVFHVGSGLH